VALVATLRLRILSTLVSWVITLLVVAVGGRWLASLPPPAPNPAMPAVDNPQEPTPEPLDEDEALELEPAAEPVVDAGALAAAAVTPGRLVVSEPLGANVRAEPSSTGRIITTLPRGTLVEERFRDGDAEAAVRGWGRVAWEGREGWVATSLLQPAGGVP
jgi:SH3 domain-containing protein